MHHVGKCDVTQCCFNKEKKCHAVAIQVGDQTPLCDTFSPTSKGRCGLNNVTADVGACKVTACRYNKDMICTADAINVGWNHNHAECVSYTPKR